jgi:hypothetical protein
VLYGVGVVELEAVFEGFSVLADQLVHLLVLHLLLVDFDQLC